MKTRVETPQAKTFGGGQVKKFTIKQDHKTFRAFSDGLYSDKIAAIIRELSSNAVDAHRSAKNMETPFELFLPCSSNPKFSIRDYGTGLSDKQIDDIYTVYGESTKEDDNDNIGGFGLGSKTPFAYTDQFFIRSYYNGEVTTYSFYFDEDEPAYLQLGKEETIEPNGLEIFFDVDDADFDEFSYKASRILPWMQIFPNVWGSSTEENGFFKENESTNHRDGWLVDHNSKIISQTEAFSLVEFDYLPNINFCQGGVIYALGSNVSDYPELSLLNNVLARGMKLVINCDIGTLELARSRETLSLSKKITIPNMKKLGKNLIESGVDNLKEALSNSESSFAMNKFYHQIINARQASVRGEVEFNNKNYSRYLLQVGHQCVRSDKEYAINDLFPFQVKDAVYKTITSDFIESHIGLARFISLNSQKWSTIKKARDYEHISYTPYNHEKVRIICRDGVKVNLAHSCDIITDSKDELVIMIDIATSIVGRKGDKKDHFKTKILPDILSYFGANEDDIVISYESDFGFTKQVFNKTSYTKNNYSIYYSENSRKVNLTNNIEKFDGKKVIYMMKDGARISFDNTSYVRSDAFERGHYAARLAGFQYDILVAVNSKELKSLEESAGTAISIDKAIKRVKKGIFNPAIIKHLKLNHKINFINDFLYSLNSQEQSIYKIVHSKSSKKSELESLKNTLKKLNDKIIQLDCHKLLKLNDVYVRTENLHYRFEHQVKDTISKILPLDKQTLNDWIEEPIHTDIDILKSKVLFDMDSFSSKYPMLKFVDFRNNSDSNFEKTMINYITEEEKSLSISSTKQKLVKLS